MKRFVIIRQIDEDSFEALPQVFRSAKSAFQFMPQGHYGKLSDDPKAWFVVPVNLFDAGLSIPHPGKSQNMKTETIAEFEARGGTITRIEKKAREKKPHQSVHEKEWFI